MIHAMKTRLVSRVAAAVLVSAACSAHALEEQPCPAPVMAAVMQTLKPTSAEAIVASACKRWPLDDKTLVLAVAYDTGQASQKSLFVAMFDTDREKFGPSYHGTLEEDAVLTVSSGSLRIDTARYELAPGRRAFGVDVSSAGSGPRCADGGLGPTRTLYLPMQGKLVPVLEEFGLYQWGYVEGSNPNCGSGPMGGGLAEEMHFSLSVAGTASHGLRDLVVTGLSTVGDERKPYRKPFKTTLKFNGTRYPHDLFTDIMAWRSTR